jgi:CBS domain-containing protein
MSNLNYFTISATATLLDAIELIARNKARCVVVLAQDKVAGVLSEGDILRALLRGTSTCAVISQVLKPSFVYLQSVDLRKAFELFRRFLFTLIPVVDDELRLRDVITLQHVLEHVEFSEPTELSWKTSSS